MDGEVWKPVVGYEGGYEVSNFARVRTLKWKKTPHVMFQRVTKRGYYAVRLSINDKPRGWNVHSLVATAFLGPRPERMEVCHNDGNRLNSVLSNLRYGTRADNIHDAMKHGTFRCSRDIGEPYTCLTADQVKEIFLSSGNLTEMARKYGIHRTHPGKIKSRKMWKSVTDELVVNR